MVFSTSESKEKKNEREDIINGYPLTNAPVIPDILKQQVKYKRIRDTYRIPRLAFTFAQEGAHLVEPKSLEMIREKLRNWFRQYPQQAEYFKKPLPRNLIAISFPHLSFHMGKESCHDFKLANGHKEAENSFYTYRKLSESVQCAYYNENGVEYLAGGVFYPAPYGRPKLLRSNDALVYFVTSTSVMYPPDDRRKSHHFEKYKIYGRKCAGKWVTVTCDTRDGIPRHKEFDHTTNRYMYTLCNECLEDFRNYKWEEPKKDAPGTKTDAAVTNDSVLSPVVRADSTESLRNEFDGMKVSCEDLVMLIR